MQARKAAPRDLEKEGRTALASKDELTIHTLYETMSNMPKAPAVLLDLHAYIASLTKPS